MSATEESIWLSEDDVFELTERRQKSGQVRALNRLGVPYILNASGKPLVPKDWINGKKTEKKKEKWQPNGLGSYGT